MKISASIYSSKNRSLKELVRELDECHIDYFHIDCNDEPDVFEDIKAIRGHSKTPIDIHLITSKPEQFFEAINKHKIEKVTFQYENLEYGYELPGNLEGEVGLAIVSDTPVEVFAKYQDVCDFILIMTTTPGQSGGKFQKENFKKIRKFRSLFPDKKIHVDGGVNDEVGFLLRLLGVNTVVSGSYLVNHHSIGMALLHLKSSIIDSKYMIKDFMIDLEDSPITDERNINVKKVIRQVEDYRLGFTVIVDKDKKLKGISSSADIRKGLLKNLNDFNKMSLTDITNYNPISINEEATISEMLALIKSKSFPINYFPVVDNENYLKGSLSFWNLIRSES
ncbi:MAG TPA: CBS domain-containing protein [Cyclobacteriaceae bacterium]